MERIPEDVMVRSGRAQPFGGCFCPECITAAWVVAFLARLQSDLWLWWCYSLTLHTGQCGLCFAHTTIESVRVNFYIWISVGFQIIMLSCLLKSKTVFFFVCWCESIIHNLRPSVALAILAISYTVFQPACCASNLQPSVRQELYFFSSLLLFRYLVPFSVCGDRIQQNANSNTWGT